MNKQQEDELLPTLEQLLNKVYLENVIFDDTLQRLLFEKFVGDTLLYFRSCASPKRLSVIKILQMEVSALPPGNRKVSTEHSDLLFERLAGKPNDVVTDPKTGVDIELRKLLSSTEAYMIVA